jgi:hypothetical protein
MSRLHEPLERHIHQEIASEINQEIIHIKIHHRDLSDQSAEQQAKIIEARKRCPEPQWDRIIDLLERAHLELIQCRQPYKIR